MASSWRNQGIMRSSEKPKDETRDVILSFIVFESLSFGFRVKISNCAYEVNFWLLNCYSKSFWIENDLITSYTGANCGTYQHTPTRAKRMAKLFFFYRSKSFMWIRSSTTARAKESQSKANLQNGEKRNGKKWFIFNFWLRCAPGFRNFQRENLVFINDHRTRFWCMHELQIRFNSSR